MSNYMGERAKINGASDVKHVTKRMSGRKKLISIIASATGLDYGLMKVILYGSFVFFQDTANLNYIASRIIGLGFHQKRILIFQNANTLFTMELISIRRGVLLA